MGHVADRQTLLDALRVNLDMRFRHPRHARHWRTMARNKIRLIRELDRRMTHAPAR